MFALLSRISPFVVRELFAGHDSGHSGITHDRKLDTLIGIIAGNLFTGISLAWWKLSHNVHHIVCNSVEHDPDIQHLPMLACSTSILHSGAQQNQVCPCESCAPLLVASALERAGSVTVSELHQLKSAASPSPAPTRSISSQPSSTSNQVPSSIPAESPGFWGWQPLFYSTFHRKWFGLNGISRAVLSMQHFRTPSFLMFCHSLWRSPSEFVLPIFFVCSSVLPLDGRGAVQFVRPVMDLVDHPQ